MIIIFYSSLKISILCVFLIKIPDFKMSDYNAGSRNLFLRYQTTYIIMYIFLTMGNVLYN